MNNLNKLNKIVKEKEEIKKRNYEEKIQNKYFILDESTLPQQIDHALGKINIDGKNYRYYGAFIYQILEQTTKNQSTTTQQRTKAIILENGFILTKEHPHNAKFEFSSEMSLKNNRWSMDSIKQFTEKKAIKTSFKEVYKEFKNIYEQNMVFENQTWYKVDAIWDICTYFFDIVDKFLIIKHEGISGTAKSKGMKISSNLSFNGRKFLCPTPANFFRYRNNNKATIYIEEAERLFGDTKNKDDNELVEYLNGSYEKGNYVPRQNDKNINQTDEFDPAGFTRIGSIKPLKGALEKRSITKYMIKAKAGDERATTEISTENEPEYVKARDKAYICGLQNYKEYEEALKIVQNDYGLVNREWQVAKPIIAVAKCIDIELEREIGLFLKDIFERRDDNFDETSWHIQFIFSLIDCAIKNNNSGFISGNEYASTFRTKIGHENMSQRAITNIAKEVGFAEYYARTTGGLRGLKIGFEEIIEIVLRNQIMTILDLKNYASLESLASLPIKKEYYELLEAKLKKITSDSLVTLQNTKSLISDASDGLTLVSGVEESIVDVLLFDLIKDLDAGKGVSLETIKDNYAFDSEEDLLQELQTYSAEGKIYEIKPEVYKLLN